MLHVVRWKIINNVSRVNSSRVSNSSIFLQSWNGSSLIVGIGQKSLPDRNWLAAIKRPNHKEAKPMPKSVPSVSASSSHNMIMKWEPHVIFLDSTGLFHPLVNGGGNFEWMGGTVPQRASARCQSSIPCDDSGIIVYITNLAFCRA